MSLAIFISATASVLSAPCAATRPSCAASAANLLAALTKGRPLSRASSAATRAPKPGWVLRPVPTAVPPMASGYSEGRARDERFGVVELGDVAGELLAEGQRRRVLQMGAADLDDVGEASALAASVACAAGQRRQQHCVDAERRGDVHGGREDIVRRLPEIDVVVGCTQALRCPRSPPSSSEARLASTSLMFMLLWVPEPVCQTDSGNSASWRPSEDFPGGRGMMALALSPAAARARR
jgi:hypothetical protein